MNRGWSPIQLLVYLLCRVVSRCWAVTVCGPIAAARGRGVIIMPQLTPAPASPVRKAQFFPLTGEGKVGSKTRNTDGKN